MIHHLTDLFVPPWSATNVRESERDKCISASPRAPSTSYPQSRFQIIVKNDVNYGWGNTSQGNKHAKSE